MRRWFDLRWLDLRWLDRAAEALACLVLVALLVAVSLGALTRGLDDPLVWTDESARFLMVWLACLGWMVSSRKRGHVRIRFFQNLLPPLLWRVMEAAIQLGMALLGAVVCWYGADLVARNYDLEATTLPISIAWSYVPLVPAGLVTLGQALGELAATLRPRAA